MEFERLLFSSIYFIAVSLYLHWGINLVKMEQIKKERNILFTAFFALAIWTFGYFMLFLVPSYEMALFWKRVSMVGMSSVFTLLLYFSILLAYTKLSSRNRIFLAILHLPALINMYIFSFSNSLARNQYQLISVDNGWTHFSKSNTFDVFFRSYAILYILLVLHIIWSWQQRLRDRKTAKNIRIVLYSLTTAAVLTILTAVLLPNLLNQALINLGPLWAIVPAGAIYRAVKNYDLFEARIIPEEMNYITWKEQGKIFNNFSFGFYLAAFLAFAATYLPNIGERTAFIEASKISIILFSIGLAISIIQWIHNKKIKRILTTIVLVFSIPIILYQFRQNAAVTVWAFPIIISISSTILSNQVLLYLVTIFSIVGQLLLWAFHPEMKVLVTNYDYILRIILIIGAFSTAVFTNKLYISKLDENNRQIKFKGIVSDVLFEFIEVTEESYDKKVDHLLEKIGTFFLVDRVHIYSMDPENQSMSYSKEWANGRIVEDNGEIDKIELKDLPWWLEQLENEKIVLIEDVDELAEEAFMEKLYLEERKVKSLLSVPIMVNGKIHSVIGIQSFKRKEWTTDNIEMLKIMAKILSNGIVHLESDKKIKNMAYYDSLTKLPNRVLFSDRINEAIKLAKVNNQFVSVMFIDLDEFKIVNDTMGHDGGDYLLQKVSERLKEQVRETDTVSRFGGDEFIVLLNNINSCKDVPVIAEKVLSIFSSPFLIKEQEFFITASGGLSTYPLDGKDPDQLIKNADLAMYEAKGKGKNQYSLSSSEMLDEVQKNMELSNDLYHAIERNELSVHYQAQVHLDSEEITGFEALLRWNHPELGMISPGVFIPLAERTDLIHTIGFWVLETVCKQNKKWQDEGYPPLPIAVNLSAVQFTSEDLVGNVKSILEKTKLVPEYLELEVTESVAIRDTKSVAHTLAKLKETGVSIAIDDFGTEYSSLSKLKELPIDKLKIDIEFIRGIAKNKKDQAITKTIINLAKNLNLSVLAEGVETKEQLTFLKEKDCDSVQGFYYYKPIPAEKVEELFKQAADEEAIYLKEFNPRFIK